MLMAHFEVIDAVPFVHDKEWKRVNWIQNANLAWKGAFVVPKIVYVFRQKFVQSAPDSFVFSIALLWNAQTAIY